MGLIAAAHYICLKRVRGAHAAITLAAMVNCLGSTPPALAEPARLTISSKPARPYIERRGSQQLVAADLLVGNPLDRAYTLVALKLALFDAQNRPEYVRELDPNGHPPAIELMNTRSLPAHATADFFLPFSVFDGFLDLHRMHIDLLFMRAGRTSAPVPFTADQVVSLDLFPRTFLPPAECLPLQARQLVFDGHDMFSHHRRYDLSSVTTRMTQRAVNRNLYALDFVQVGPGGELFADSAASKKNWFTYGAPVSAPEPGVIISAENGVADNRFSSDGFEQDAPADKADPYQMGNHVAIAYPGGRVGWLLHLQAGSVQVHVGQSVAAGQLVGRVGFSGDALFPHLHYNVTDGPEFWSQGVPTYFSSFLRLAGSRRLEASGQLDTGDMIENPPGRCHNP